MLSCQDSEVAECCRQLSLGDWFLLAQIGCNIDSHIFGQLINQVSPPPHLPLSCWDSPCFRSPADLTRYTGNLRQCRSFELIMCLYYYNYEEEKDELSYYILNNLLESFLLYK